MNTLNVAGKQFDLPKHPSYNLIRY